MQNENGGQETKNVIPFDESKEKAESVDIKTPHVISRPLSKRKCSWNLEDIVLKLKRSKNKEDNKKEKSPSKTSDDLKDDENECVLSPVFPKNAIDDDSYFNQKSSLLTQLEHKDNLILMESYERELSPETNSTEETVSIKGDSSSVDESENIKTKLVEKVDSQLEKLLEEEKLLGSEADDKIDETKCNKCNKRFYRRSQLIRHLSNHVIHECLHCNALFYCVKKYKKHMSSHETYPCDFCNEEFYDASAWYKHRAKHTMIECSCCDMIFYNRTALAKHKFEHSQYICPLCRYTCENLHHWISHRNCHGRCSLLQPVIACKECKLTFGSQEAFLKHNCNLEKTLPNSLMTSPNTVTGEIIKPFPPVSQRKNKQLLRKHSDSHQNLIRRPKPVYLCESKVKRCVYPFQYQTKQVKGKMDKKDIKSLIGVDQTLSCFS